MSKKLFALIKWVGGEDDRKYTVGIPVEWIKGFNYEEYLLTSDEDSTYVIEWRKSKKPLGGWDCYDGYVIEVSDRLTFLKQKLNQIDGILSPIKIYDPKESNHSSTAATTSDTNISQDSTQSGSGTNNVKRVAKRVDESTKSSKGELYKQITAAKKNAPTATIHPPKYRRLELEKFSDEEKASEDDIESGVVEINNDSNLLKQMIKGNKKIGDQLAKVCSELKHQRKNRARRDDSYHSSSDSSDEERMVRIGPKKLRVRVTASQSRTAKAQSTYTAMGISLVMALFPLEVLLRSNLKGGARKIAESRNVPKFDALDKNIRDAIYDCVQTYHPKTFTLAGLGIAINNKLCALRRAEKKEATAPEHLREPEDEDYEGVA